MKQSGGVEVVAAAALFSGGGFQPEKGKKLILKSLSYLRRNGICLGYVIIENLKHVIYNPDGRTNSLLKTFCLMSILI